MRAVPVPIEWRPELSIYASESFLRTVSPEYGWLGGVDSSGETICILPYSVIRRSIFRLIRFSVETIPLGPDLNIMTERSFLNAAVEYFRSIGADLIVPATFNSLFRTCPDGALTAPYGNSIVDLRAAEDVLWSKIHHKHRNVIRGAMKKGVTIRSGLDGLETAYRLTRESFNRSSTGVLQRARVQSRLEYGTFRDQVLSFGEWVLVLVAEHGGVAQSSAVIPFSRHSAYYMHGGSIEHPITGASNLLQWEAMKQCRDLGVGQYNFFGTRIDPIEGSKAEGIAKFKTRFGGESRRGFMWKFAFDRVKGGLYALASRVRSGGDVVDQERHKLVAPHG